MLTPSLRKLLYKVTPRTLRRLRSSRIGKEMQKQKEMERLLYASAEGKVMGGPFKGLKYCDEACGSMLGPKLLGVYESEIQEVIGTIIKREYDHVIDIGAAEGYYAVGLLTACANLSVTAFETSSNGRKAMERMAEQNHVTDRLSVLGHCEASDLQNVVGNSEKELIICDIEGGEIVLLNPEVNSGLKRSDILVEVHDFVDINISSTLLKRFSPTHDITRLRSKPHTSTELPQIAQFSKEQMLILASERRPCVMEWFWMRSHANAD